MAVLVPAAVLSPTRSPRTSTFANATLRRPIIMRFAYVRAISITAARCLQPLGYDEVRYAMRARMASRQQGEHRPHQTQRRDVTQLLHTATLRLTRPVPRERFRLLLLWTAAVDPILCNCQQPSGRPTLSLRY
jgi:hypothetical protein